MTKRTDETLKIEKDFIRQVDNWFSKGMGVWDNELDRQISKWYSEVKDVFPKRPYYSPSSLNSCPRELYLKAKRAERDSFPVQPHQGRWQKLGGMGGDMLQRELLMMEKHYNKVTGDNLKFKFLRNPDGTPMFEEFAKKNHPISIDGESFFLFGAPDGIMEYTKDDGEKVRVGLEIKSKQTTNARTSEYSMRDAEESHIVQSVAYAEMYDCDLYMIVYVNYSKKSWNMTDAEYEKTPDMRAFCYEIKPQDKFEMLMYPAKLEKAIKENEPPKLDIHKWTFNNYKLATAKSLTMEEISEAESDVNRAVDSPIPQWMKYSLGTVVGDIMSLRETGEIA